VSAAWEATVKLARQCDEAVSPCAWCGHCGHRKEDCESWLIYEFQRLSQIGRGVPEISPVPSFEPVPQRWDFGWNFWPLFTCLVSGFVAGMAFHALWMEWMR
jgi:hypothetical protein